MDTVTLNILDTSPSKCGKTRREDLKPGECLCTYCTAKCCRYFALAMDKPTTWRDFDHMRWFLLHEKASVFVEDGDFYLLVHTPCKHLQPNNLCGIYETRPNICRSYTTDNCEYDDTWVYDHYWETAEQVVEYAEAVLGPRRGAEFSQQETVGLHNLFLPKWQSWDNSSGPMADANEFSPLRPALF